MIDVSVICALTRSAGHRGQVAAASTVAQSSCWRSGLQKGPSPAAKARPGQVRPGQTKVRSGQLRSAQVGSDKTKSDQSKSGACVFKNPPVQLLTDLQVLRKADPSRPRRRWKERPLQRHHKCILCQPEQRCIHHSLQENGTLF
eukprot:COSAG06_NODE_2420_length_6905_cov_5.610344_2_plen_144_part_00